MDESVEKAYTHGGRGLLLDAGYVGFRSDVVVIEAVTEAQDGAGYQREFEGERLWGGFDCERGATVASTDELIAQQPEDLLHAGAGLCLDLEDLDSRAYAFDISASRGQVEFGSLGHIHLGDDSYVGAIEDGGIFERLVFAFGSG